MSATAISKSAEAPARGQAARVPATAADALFDAIDGRMIEWSGLRYEVEVYGITEMPDARWLQLALHGAPERMVTLRLAPGSDPASAMHALWILLADCAAQGVADNLA